MPVVLIAALVPPETVPPLKSVSATNEPAAGPPVEIARTKVLEGRVADTSLERALSPNGATEGVARLCGSTDVTSYQYFVPGVAVVSVKDGVVNPVATGVADSPPALVPR